MKQQKSKKTINKSELRKAYFLNKYVLITPGRAKRPKDIKEETIIKKSSNCPFCPENIDQKNILDEIKEKNKWQVISLKNIFPAVSLNNKNAYGNQEVIVETRNHSKELADLSQKEIENIFKMYIRRTTAISKIKNIEYILCFKNQGSKAGASISHSHSQIFATNIIPPDISEELKLAQDYKTEHKKCPYCDIIEQEKKSKRKIYEDKYIFAFTPYASEYHYEVWIISKRHIDNITNLNAQELKSFIKIYKHILKKLQNINLSFNAFLHQVISNNDQHFYMKIQPRESVWAGVELGSGLVINSIAPEDAAKFYREKLK
jgi:UDPglucose--hexose-1-phosphate uridylyltransferase